MNEMMGYLITIVAIFGISAFCSMTRNGFSLDIFMCAMVISFGVMIWKNMLPFSTIALCAVVIMGLLFSQGSDDDE